MYLNRISTPEFKKSQFVLRMLKLNLCDSNKLGLPVVISKLEEIIAVVTNLITFTKDTFDEPYFQFLECSLLTIKYQGAYLQALKTGDVNADALKKANQFNHDLLKELTGKLDSSRPSINELSKLSADISDCLKITEFNKKIEIFGYLRLPFIEGIESNPFSDFRRDIDSPEETSEEEPEPLMLSVRFSTDNELWANPQILKPGIQYAINGLIKLNRLPSNYQTATIHHVSTTSDDFFILSLPEIKLTNKLEYNISGHIIFKYPQNTFDPPVAIKLIAQFNSISASPIYPQLIGYDELITQIIDEKTFQYPTGFSKLNKKAWEIGLEIKKDLPNIEQTELDHFIILLTGILNYSGYCASYGIYKNINHLTEDEFRDRLIAYMSANPMIGGDIIKEGSIGGGRVEIRYKNIIAELKVEKKVSDRTKMVKQHKRQPSAYASSVSADLAILCILDLTPKLLPPAPASNNVILEAASFHGFENTPTTSKVAVVIIDGNLKNPSSY